MKRVPRVRKNIRAPGKIPSNKHKLFWHGIRRENWQEPRSGVVMHKMKYQFAELSRTEREYLEMVLLEEMDMQTWFSVVYTDLIDGEVLVTLQ